MVKASFLLVGDSGAGKTAQIGEMAKHVFKESGGKVDLKTKKIVEGSGLTTRVYTADSGGWVTIQPLVNIGLVEIVPLQTSSNFFYSLTEAIKGKVPQTDPKTGKISWVQKLKGVGLIAHEGLSAYSDCLMRAMADMAAKGINIGGGGAFNFDDGPLKVGSNNQGHYLQAQEAIKRFVADSQWLLPSEMITIWTAVARRGEDDNLAQVLGPQAAGKALTHDLPRWIQYTFRITKEPQEDGSVKHRLYLEGHKDKMLKGAVGLGNSRVALDAEAIKMIPTVIEPASIVEAYKAIMKAAEKAEENVLKELA